MINSKIVIAFLFLLKMNTIAAQTDGLNIEGKSVLTDLVTLKTTVQAGSDSKNVALGNLKNLVIDSNGVVLAATAGSPTVKGGFRPGSQTALFTAETSSSVTRVRYIAHVDNSSAGNQGLASAYSYGEFTVVFINGTGKIINMTCFDGAGNVRTFTDVAPSGDIASQKMVDGSYNTNQGNFSFIVRTDGRIGVSAFATASYFLEFMGGI